MNKQRNLGQHFISCTTLLNKIIDEAGNLEGCNVLEIGPGKGNLTKEILKRKVQKLVAIEYDRSLKNYHNNILKDPRYHLIFADALKIDESSLLNKPIHIIANLPYNISIPLIFKWLEHTSGIAQITVMIQKEVALRLCATSGTKRYGRMSILAQIKADIKTRFNVTPEFFNPPPKVDSSVIIIKPKKTSEISLKHKKSLDALLNATFNHRRKTLKNSLKKIMNVDELSKIDMYMDKRPEQITVSEFISISTTYDFSFNKSKNRA